MVQMLVVSLPRVEVWVGNMRMRESGVDMYNDRLTCWALSSNLRTTLTERWGGVEALMGRTTEMMLTCDFLTSP